jgi:hypothetical protein
MRQGVIVSHRISAYHPDPPPRSVVYLGFAAGALEGLIAGWIYGGIAAIFPSIFIGATIGSVIGVIAWRIRRLTRSFIRPFLVGITIEALGGGLIVLATRMNVLNAVDLNAPLFFAVTLGLPASVLCLRLMCREIIAMRRGLIVGVIIGPIVFGYLIGAIAAQGMGGNAAILLFILGCISGVLMGVVVGGILCSLLGGLVGALVNVRRSSIVPTYGGLAAAIGLGLIGFYAGEAIAGDLGGLIGVAYGLIYGALLGAKFAKVVAPYQLPFIIHYDEGDPNQLPALDLSDARDLADADPAHLALYQILLLAIRLHCQYIRLEQGDIACTATLTTDSSSSTFSCPLPLYSALIRFFIDPARIEFNGSSGQMDRQERRFRLRLHPHLLDASIAYQSDRDGERIDLCWSYDAAAVKRAERISNLLQFVLKVRNQLMTPVNMGRGVD